MNCVRRAKKYVAAKDRGKPPYSAHGCAWQTRRGANGRLWASRPNDQGQFAWVAVPPTRLQRARSAARGAWRDYAPTAVEYAVWRAGKAVHQALLPGIDYDNHELAWQQADPRTPPQF